MATPPSPANNTVQLQPDGPATLKLGSPAAVYTVLPARLLSIKNGPVVGAPNGFVRLFVAYSALHGTAFAVAYFAVGFALAGGTTVLCGVGF
jgi:hypothetical protein